MCDLYVDLMWSSGGRRLSRRRLKGFNKGWRVAAVGVRVEIHNTSHNYMYLSWYLLMSNLLIYYTQQIHGYICPYMCAVCGERERFITEQPTLQCVERATERGRIPNDCNSHEIHSEIANAKVQHVK